jgi:hypothetical protein
MTDRDKTQEQTSLTEITCLINYVPAWDREGWEETIDFPIKLDRRYHDYVSVEQTMHRLKKLFEEEELIDLTDFVIEGFHNRNYKNTSFIRVKFKEPDSGLIYLIKWSSIKWNQK